MKKLLQIKNQEWKRFLIPTGKGYYDLVTEDLQGIPVRLFLNEPLLQTLEEDLYPQIVNATRFKGVKLVVITPDVHRGYGVPVGCVILTDADSGSVAMGPVGYDIGCGMISAQSSVPFHEATLEKRITFHRAIMDRVRLGSGGQSYRFTNLTERDFQELVRGGAEYYVHRYGALFDRSRSERHRIPVDDTWQIPWGGLGNPERGINQLGSLGGGNHFIELQRSVQTGTLFVQIHTGSRGFGHGLATNYFHLAKEEYPERGNDIDLGYFEPHSIHYRGYLNAVAAAGNYAIINRLVIFEEVAKAFQLVFGQDLELVYEISHNLVQKEWHPDYGDVWVHRKGSTRAFPKHHPLLQGTLWENTGHPVLIPGSNKDFSYILRPTESTVHSGYSVNHGSGRLLSRNEAVRKLSPQVINQAYRDANILVNLDGEVPIDEAAPCYKPAKDVLSAILDANLAKVDHELWPLSSLKGTEMGRTKFNRKSNHF